MLGVLWREDNIIGRANEALGMLRALGKKIFYITNNSTKTREDYVKKCESMNFVADKLSHYSFILLYIDERHSLKTSANPKRLKFHMHKYTP